MKLFLCGGGSGKQIIDSLKRFSEEINKSKPILYVPLAMESDKYDSCKSWFEGEIQNIGITDFDMITSSLELSNKDLEKYSAIFIGGGNTYKLLWELKKHSNIKKIDQYLKNGGVVFGGSAGAIIFGKNIDCCLYEDGNLINLKDCDGFNYLNNISLLCHLNEKHLEKNKDYLINCSNKNKIIYLPEEDVIFINDGNIELIGKQEYILFSNGKYNFHSYLDIKEDIDNK